MGSILKKKEGTEVLSVARVPYERRPSEFGVGKYPFRHI
jgi:hypothetical protein